MEGEVSDVVAVPEMPVLDKNTLSGLNGKSLGFIHDFVDRVVIFSRQEEERWRDHNDLVEMTYWLITEKGLDLSQSDRVEIISLAEKFGYAFP